MTSRAQGVAARLDRLERALVGPGPPVRFAVCTAGRHACDDPGRPHRTFDFGRAPGCDAEGRDDERGL